MSKPHVLVDARFTEHRRGGDRCRLELAKGLLSRGGCRYTFLVFPSGREILRSIQPDVQTVIAPYVHQDHPRADYFEHVTLPRISRKLNVDIYHGTFHGMPLRRAARRTIVTIHDLAIFEFPRAYSRMFGVFMRAWLRQAIIHTDHLIAVSDATRAEIVKRYAATASKITTIHNGVGSEFGKPVAADAVRTMRQRLNLPAAYILFVGNLEKKKNLLRLIQAFLSLRSAGAITESLVVAGSNPGKLPSEALANLFAEGEGELVDRARAKGVCFTGYISDEDLPALYQGARAIAYPSLYEGFGMPVLEGMASGVPVLTSNVSSLPEVAGGAALLVDPLDVNAIATGLKVVLHDQAWRSSAIFAGVLRAAASGWDRHVEQVENLYLSQDSQPKFANSSNDLPAKTKGSLSSAVSV